MNFLRLANGNLTKNLLFPQQAIEHSRYSISIIVSSENVDIVSLYAGISKFIEIVENKIHRTYRDV